MSVCQLQRPKSFPTHHPGRLVLCKLIGRGDDENSNVGMRARETYLHASTTRHFTRRSDTGVGTEQVGVAEAARHL
jgi:hypothetical protein